MHLILLLRVNSCRSPSIWQQRGLRQSRWGSEITWVLAVLKVDRRIRWHYTTTILRLRIGARLTRYRNCKFHNGCRTIRRHADGISRYSVPPSAGPLLPLSTGVINCYQPPTPRQLAPWTVGSMFQMAFMVWRCIQASLFTRGPSAFARRYAWRIHRARIQWSWSVAWPSADRAWLIGQCARECPAGGTWRPIGIGRAGTWPATAPDWFAAVSTTMSCLTCLSISLRSRFHATLRHTCRPISGTKLPKITTNDTINYLFLKLQLALW